MRILRMKRGNGPGRCSCSQAHGLRREGSHVRGAPPVWAEGLPWDSSGRQVDTTANPRAHIPSAAHTCSPRHSVTRSAVLPPAYMSLPAPGSQYR